MMRSPLCFDSSRPYPDQLKAPEGLNACMVHRADDAFPFLHDTVVASLGGRLFVAWYNCSEDEIVGRTVIRGRWSEDGGRSWSAPEIVAEDRSKEGLHCVPVTLHEQSGRAYAYATLMRAHDRPLGYARLTYEDGAWRALDRLEEPVLFNSLPQRLPDGRWICAGRMSAAAGQLPLIPVILTGAGSGPIAWRIQILPGPWQQGEYPLMYPETALIVNGEHLTCAVRNDAGACWAYESHDGGTSWQGPVDIPLPIAPAKLAAGLLSTGREYLIYNQITAARDRSRLVIAVREAGAPFDSVYLLRDGYDASLSGGPFWHYPCACEVDGRLFISCTSSAPGTPIRHAALLSMPISSL